MKKNIINYFNKIEQQDLTDLVIEQIQTLIVERKLNPGDRLPSEKRLEERMGLPRIVISKAMKRLETYGIVYTLPQSGTYIRETEIEVLEGLIANITNTSKDDFVSLANVRRELEVYAVKLVIKNSTDEELEALAQLQAQQADHYREGRFSFNEDMLFHLRLAAYSKNIVLKTELTRLNVAMLDILNSLADHIDKESINQRLSDAIHEHCSILEAIKDRDVKKAEYALREHFAHAQLFNDQLTR
ncbi:MAG: FCD domain-containing protein [Spirochaetia bacterium]|nr:FCD domain-containing protein [Spirochaetia bacterium]